MQRAPVAEIPERSLAYGKWPRVQQQTNICMGFLTYPGCSSLVLCPISTGTDAFLALSFQSRLFGC